LWVEPNSARTALHKAAFWGHAHIVPWLLAPPPTGCGLDPNAVDFNGDTALHDAARFGHTDVVNQLLEHGASVYIKNKQGQTPAATGIENGKDVAEQGLTSRCCIL
jgi:ankyrin repeat protein